ncbi:hypothetical protein AALO_G00280340 [Alosa alosa]|uniref:Serine protease n=1 Tax=Alosa alosa TaxID=278164 RepID=A0AAV6FJ78_9TELE|nr:hypothetical protein AALO_G00280340 [Alosa alosa]
MSSSNANCLIYMNNEIQIYDPKMKKKLVSHPICLLYSSEDSGHGFYIREKAIMTSDHVFKKNRRPDVISCFFPSDDFVLIFKIDSESYQSYPEADIGILHFDADPSPLGVGLYDKMYLGPPAPGIDIYFTTFDESNLGAPIKHHGTIIPVTDSQELLENEFLMNTHGKPGDSGSPIFDQKGRCAGLYRGILCGNGRGVYLNCSLQPQSILSTLLDYLAQFKDNCSTFLYFLHLVILPNQFMKIIISFRTQMKNKK